MKRKHWLTAVAGLLIGAGVMAQAPRGQAPTQAPPAPAVPSVVRPAAQAPPVVQAPTERKRHRGAKSSRHHWAAYQATGNRRFVHEAKAAPAQFVPATIPAPGSMSYWLNDQYGDCVTAEECFAKYIYPIYFTETGTPIDMPDSLVRQ